MSAPRLLVAGIGNVLLGDDGFGVEVARRLLARGLPPGVRVVDYGVRGLDLLLDLLDERWEAAVLVDAMPRGGAPGTLYVVEPSVAPGALLLDGHGLTPAVVLEHRAALGAGPLQLRVVGCEPASASDDDPVMALSPAVAAAVEPAADLVASVAASLLERHEGAGRA